MTAGQTAFHTALETVCTKYFVQGQRPLTPLEIAEGPAKMLEAQQALFEQFLLFDRLAIRIRGENVPFILLLQLFGERGIEQLLDQGALSFVQWKPTILHMVTDIPGIDAIASGNMNSAAYDDPETSVDLSFKWMTNPPRTAYRKYLRRKITPLYQFPDATLPGQVAVRTKSAYQSGKLTPFGLTPDEPYDRLPLAKRKQVNDCGSEILDYTYALDAGLTSYTSRMMFTLLAQSIEALRAQSNPADRFGAIAKLENLPDLKSLYPKLHNPLGQVPALRANRTSKRFRRWLAETDKNGAELSAAYLAAIADAKGLFDTPVAKITKAIALTGIGMGLGAAAGAAVDGIVSGSLIGGALSRIADPAVDVGLDLLDSFLLEGIVKGWTPRMFFDDVRALPLRDLRDLELVMHASDAA
ncbi:MAG TPA: hypothetical protein VIJ85_13375 [Rhizomicrobium sp.]